MTDLKMFTVMINTSERNIMQKIKKLAFKIYLDVDTDTKLR